MTRKTLTLFACMIASLTVCMGKKIELKDITEGTFAPKYVTGIRPLEGTDKYCKISEDGRQIIMTSFRKGAKPTVAYQIADSDTSRIQYIDGYSFSPNGKRILIRTDYKPVYRRSFHARYSCKGKEYCYEIWNHPVREPFLAGRALHYWYPIDEALLDQAARHYLGSHDFSSFCTLDKRERGDLTRRVFTSRVERRGDLVVFTVGADGFLYNMVRIMVGTLLRVQQGKFSPEDIPGILEAKDRKAAGPTAPACGLYLNRVFY